MTAPSLYLLAADAVLAVHLLFVVFVILALIAIFVGSTLSWTWIRNPVFRLAHLIAIAVVASQAWLGIVCPLTTVEMALRSRAGEMTYAGTFISHWMQKLLYYQAPDWVFVVCYSAFGMLVIVGWYFIRPRPFRKHALRKT